jgi:hypothetical protein
MLSSQNGARTRMHTPRKCRRNRGAAGHPPRRDRADAGDSAARVCLNADEVAVALALIAADRLSHATRSTP